MVAVDGVSGFSFSVYDDSLQKSDVYLMASLIVEPFEPLGETENAFTSLRQEWNELLARSDNPSAFLTWEWQATWWRHFGAATNSELLLLRVTGPGNRLLAIAPLKVRRRRGIRFVEWIGFGGSAVCPDFLDFIVDRESSLEAREAIVTYLRGPLATRWDVAYLTDIRWQRSLSSDAIAASDAAVSSSLAGIVPSPTLTTVADALQGRQLIRPGEDCAFTILDRDMDSFLAARSRNFRRKARKYRNQILRRGNVEVVRAHTLQEIPALMAALADLHGQSRQAHGESGNFVLADYSAFQADAARELLNADQTVLLTISTDGEEIGSCLAYVLGGTAYFYQTGFATQVNHAGTVAMHYLAEELMADGVQILDFLRGAHEYKQHWADGSTRTAHIAFPSTHARGQIAFRLLREVLRWRDRTPE